MVVMESGDVKTARLGRLQAIIGQLQSLATYCNANANTSARDRDSAATASLRKVLKGSTSMLMVLMDVCDDFFKADGEVEDFDEDIRGYDNMVSKLTGQLPPTAAAAASASAGDGDTATPICGVDIDACSWLRRRKDEERAYLAALPAHTVPGLQHLTSLIRQREQSYAFLKGLWDDKQTVAASLGCSASQFTYGSSLFQLWRAATAYEVWADRVAHCRHTLKRDVRVVVMGSSQGLLASFLCYCFYADSLSSTTLTSDGNTPLGERSDHKCVVVGYEVLPELHRTACLAALLTASQLGHAASSVPVLGDMFTADLRSADVVVLTSLCWDTTTRARVAWKLARELPKGAVVVDFTTDTFDAVGLERDKSGGSGRVRRADVHVKRDKTPVETNARPGDKDASVGSDVGTRASASARAGTDTGTVMLVDALDAALVTAETGTAARVMHTTRISTSSSTSTRNCPRSFQLAGFVEGPVSWAQEQTLAFFTAL